MYQFEPLSASPDSLAQVQRLFRTVWPRATHLNKTYLHWLYAENPHGTAFGFNAFTGERELAAHYATIPIEAALFGQRVRGLLSLNTATHPSHQGKKLFTQLANQTFDSAKAAGYQFVIGVANANSTPGFTRKLGFRLVCPLQARLGMGTIAKRGYSPGESAPGFQVRWHGEALAWRLRTPGRRYGLQKTAAHRLSVVSLKSGLPFIRVIMSLDVDADANDHLLPAARRPAPWLYVGNDAQLDWNKTTTLAIPKRLRPSPLNLIYRQLDEYLPSVEARDVAFCALDFDAY